MDGIIEEIVTDFTGGVGDDPRFPNKSLSQIVTGFDIFSQKYRMVPVPDSESGDNHAATSQKQNFDIGYWTPASEYRLFALGVKSGAATAEVMMKVILSTDANGDLSNDIWQTPAVNQATSGSTDFNLFRYYKTTGKIYGAAGGTNIWSFTPSGSTAFNDTERSISYSSVKQGLVHSKDDCLYIPYDNKIARNNAGVWTDAALTVPAQYMITSICEFGNYLAVGLAPKAGGGKSRVFLWDRDTSLATISESLDWGNGFLQVLEELGGHLVGISSEASINANTYLLPRIIFQYSNGSTVTPFKTLIGAAGDGGGLSYFKQKANGRIYFSMFFKIDGVMRRGLWCVGISSAGAFAISNERPIYNDTVPGNDAVQGFFVVGDYTFISHYDANSAFALSKTTESGSYTATAALETLIKNGGDSDLVKHLIGVSAMFEALGQNGQVSLYYKKDAETVWTRLFVYAVPSAISHGAVNIESDQTAVTVNIGTAVFSQANHGLSVGQKIKLHTTGALPTGLTKDTVEYYVIASGLTSSAFKVSATLGGASVALSGVQSGTHTIDRTYPLTDGKEFKLRLESNGGAVITGYKYKMEFVPKQLY